MVEQDQSGREVSDRPTANHHRVTRHSQMLFQLQSCCSCEMKIFQIMTVEIDDFIKVDYKKIVEH